MLQIVVYYGDVEFSLRLYVVYKIVNYALK